jgi:hypothetical protein
LDVRVRMEERMGGGGEESGIVESAMIGHESG